MKGALVSIGQMAKMNNTTVVTLRHYDKLGLLVPRYTDEETGYRYYDINQNARLDMIEYMKELGMSLKEVKLVLDSGDSALIETMLAYKNEQIHRQISQLKLRHDAVERTIRSIERYRKSPVTGTIALEYIDRRIIYGIDCVENFYDYDISSYERVLLAFKMHLVEKGVSQMHTYNLGTSIRKDDFLNSRFYADRGFIFLDRSALSMGLDTRIMDSGMYACIYLDSYDDEMEYADRLLSYWREKDLKVCGDYICEVLTEFNVFDDEKRSMFLRLQVPLDFSSKFV